MRTILERAPQSIWCDFDSNVDLHFSGCEPGGNLEVIFKPCKPRVARRCVPLAYNLTVDKHARCFSGGNLRFGRLSASWPAISGNA